MICIMGLRIWDIIAYTLSNFREKVIEFLCDDLRLEILLLSITNVEGKLFDFLDLLIICRRMDQVCFESVL